MFQADMEHVDCWCHVRCILVASWEKFAKIMLSAGKEKVGSRCERVNFDKDSNEHQV